MTATHEKHAHAHGPGCGHKAITHEDHTDFLHDGHLHHVHGDHVDEHVIAVGGANTAECTQGHTCGAHGVDHKHDFGCGHEAVPHGDHVDYLVDGDLHHPCGKHCDNHGKVSAQPNL
jgi:hypothetical protein